jgi:ABC-type transport system involved in multi-copper enzyme maturation permease subunit
LKGVTRVLYYLLPNFHNFNAIAAASHGEAVPASLVAQNTAYALLYVAVVLLAASAVFSRRDLK